MPEPAIPSSDTRTQATAGEAEVLPMQEQGIALKKPWQRLTVQPKLTVGAPDDPFEKEANAVADKVMRMPEQNFIQRKCASCKEEKIQREENEEKEPADKSKLTLQLTEPDFLSLRTPFFERNAMHLWDPDSALGVWKYNFGFFKRFGLDENWSGKAANLTAPFFINSQLKTQNPTWWEITDAQLNTTSIVGSLPIFSFDSDFRNWKPLPFLQKKPLDTAPVAENQGGSKENFIQRKCAHCEEEEEKINRKPLSASITPFIQTKTENNTSVVSDSLSHSIQSSKGGGSSLDSGTQTFMSERFGTDFGKVKVHTDGEAVQMNRDLNAKAFTVGHDVYFNEGQYQPGSSGGKHLLAHELTHVVQQNNFLQAKRIQRKVMDQKAENLNIKYPEAIEANKINWKEFGFNYINIFKHKGYKPTDTPNAYANEVFKLQETIILIITSEERTRFPINATGILDLNTLNWLADFGSQASIDPQKGKLLVSFGIDKEIVEKSAKISANNVTVEPLLSRDFNSHPLFNLININKTFLLSPGDQNGAVQVLQHVLMRLNYNIGEKGPDGIFGEGTTKALKAFQIESGVKKGEADGTLGYKTLRLLDKRMSVATRDFMVVSIPGGNVRMFKVPVPRLMTRDEKLLHAIVEIFKITEKDALDLINNKDDENKWGWLKDGFHETTEAELNRGYEYIGVPVVDYEKIITTIKKRNYSQGEPVEPKIKESILALGEFEKIYQLSKEIEALEAKKSGIFKSIASPATSAIEDALLQAQINDKKKERAAELTRLNITEDIYSSKSQEFKKLFASYAVKVAMEMLNRNEKEASLEMIRYKKSADPDSLEQGTAIKDIFIQLDTIWTRAEREWWQGVSVAQGASPDEITSYDSLNSFLIHKKGQRRRCFKGDCTEPADNVLPSYTATKFAKREGNAHFIKAFDSNLEAHKFLTQSAQQYKVLAYPKLQLRKNISTLKQLSPAEIEGKLFATSESIRENIGKTRDSLMESPMNVYKLKPVIELAKFQLGIFPKTIQDGLVSQALKEFEDAEFWRNIAMAALGIGLGLLALVSGPVGWAALGAGIVVGGVDAYLQYEDITFRRTAANTAFDPAKALSDVEPGYFWFYVSIAFIGLDVFQGFKAIGAAARAAKATEEGSQLAGKIINAMNEDKKALQELIAQGGDNLAELTVQLKKLDAALSTVDAQKMAQQINVLRHLNDVPQAVLRLSGSLDQPEIIKAFEVMGTLLKKSDHADDVYKNILKFYAGPGNDFVAELPEFMRLAQKTDWAAKPELLKELLTNPRSQKVMLDFGENQDQFIRHWDDWSRLKAAGKVATFTEYLKGKGFVTDLKPTKSLAAELGAEFAGKSMLTKNQQVLRTIESDLADAFIEGTLPKRVQDALTKILESDIIGQTASLARAQERMKTSLRLLGASIESPAEYQAVIRLIKNTDAKMAFFEKATSLAGHEEYVGLFTKYSKELAGDPKALDEFLRIGPFTDDDTFKWLLGNPKIRKLIADNPELVKALKKCASPCFPIHADEADILKILQAIKDGGGSVDYSRLNQYMYLNRPRNSSVAEIEKWKAAVDKLADDFKGTVKAVEMPKGSEIKLPPRFQAGGATPLKDAARKLDALIKRGFAPKQLEDILVQANINKLDANEFMEQLSRATSKLGTRPLDNISGIINGLSSTNPQKFETAFHFMRRIGDYSSGAGVDMAEKIFAVFDINQITQLRYSSAARLSADVAKVTGEVSVAGIEIFGSLVSRISGSSEDIIKLATKAGGGEADIVRLASIVNRMPAGKHSIEAIASRIEEAKLLAERIAAAGDKMGDWIWGSAKPTKSTQWKVGEKFIDEASGKVSGSLAIAHVKGMAKEIAPALLDSAGKLDPAKWKSFRKAIAETDLPSSIKSNILGEMWGRANVEAYKKTFKDANVFEQVYIRIKGTDTFAIVDAVIKDNGNILFKEFKSGDAILSPAQKKVYELMALARKPGEPELLEVFGETAAKIWPDSSKFKAAAVEIVEEKSIP